MHLEALSLSHKGYTQTVDLKPWLGISFQIDILRLDLIHQDAPGNKWFKLLPYFDVTRSPIGKTMKGVISFGGIHSNHLHALSAICHTLNLPFVAVIRGEQFLPLNATLQDIVSKNGLIHPVSRLEYNVKSDKEYQQWLVDYYGGHYSVIPEGGTSLIALAGVSKILDLVNEPECYDDVFVSVGSGGTVAGLIAANRFKKISGVLALKNGGYLRNTVNALLTNFSSATSWMLCEEYHQGGFGKMNDRLVRFIQGFYEHTGILLDPVYTGKTMMAIIERLKVGEIVNSRILFIHTGGVQGNRGHATLNKCYDSYIQDNLVDRAECI